VGRHYILTIDQGTSSSRALLISRRGDIAASAQLPVPISYPRNGWVEQDAAQLWRATRKAIDTVIAKRSLSFHDIVGIGITNQRETVVAWDRKTGKPLAPAIVWQDRRTAKACQHLAPHESLIRERTGLLLDPYFSATKIALLVKELGNNIAIGTIDSFLVWQLTGGKLHITDASNASRTQLYNIHTGEWDDDLLKLHGIPRSVLPEVRQSSELYGTTKEGIPIAGIAGDQQAALFGQACFEPGEAKITYGTGCFVLVNTGETPVSTDARLLTTVAWQMEGKTTYALEGSVFIGGAAIQWLKENLHLVGKVGEVEKLARSVPDTHGLCFVPALTGLGAPYWKPHARGMLLGITRGTSRAHLARATLEGIAHQVADVVEAIDTDITSIKVDGGAIDNTLLMQLQADFLAHPLLIPKQKERTALGAAFLAGLATGYWKNEDEIKKLWKGSKRIAPKLAEAERHRHKERWERAVHLATLWEEQ
jgi:glycerol kinase